MHLLLPFLIPGCFAVIALVCYLIARSSRRTFVCPNCRERITVEQMEAKRCGSCGAALELEKEG